MAMQRVTHAPIKPPPRLRAWGFVLALLVLVVASFASLDLQWAAFFSGDALRSMGRFAAEFFPPDMSAPFLRKLLHASLETLAMSALGTLFAALLGLLLAWPASRRAGADGGRNTLRACTVLVLNLLRSIPELVWAALLLISAGLGPLAGTLALAAHTTGVLGRLFAQAIENAPAAPAFALRAQGVGELRVLLYAVWPQVLPQLLSYMLYRWENNIRAAAVLGVVGAGGLGQLLAFHLGLFHMGKTCSVIIAMLGLVVLVDAASDWARTRMSR